MQLHFRVREATLFCYGCEAPVGDSSQYMTFDFKFLTSDWDSATAKYAVFTLKDSDPEERYVVIINDNAITEDEHVSLSNGTWQLNVVGTNSSGLRIVTDPWSILVADSLVGSQFPEIEQDIGEKILSIAEEARQQANEALELVESGALSNHDQLHNRDMPDQHPIRSITGLETELEQLKQAGADIDTMTNIDVDQLWHMVMG